MTDYNERIKRVLYTEEQIAAAVKEAGRAISEKYAGKPLLLVGFLKGSFVFMADLCRAVDAPCEIGFMAAKSYYSGTTSSGNVKITMDLDQDISKYHVVIVEDIIDSGVTLSYLAKYLLGKGAKSVRTCTLLDKPSRREVEFVPDFSGATIPDEFVIGYGLDFDEKYRNLPFVGVLKPEMYS